MNLLEELTNQLEDAKADYEAKLTTAPDIHAAYAEINTFRSEHASVKHQREMELNTFLTEQSDARQTFLTEQAEQKRQQELELTAFLAEQAVERRQRESDLNAFFTAQAEVKCQREAEFSAQQTAAKALKDAKAEVIRATRALARQEVTSAGASRREEKIKEHAAKEARERGQLAAWDAFEREARRKNPNALAEHEARLARDAKYTTAEHAAENARIATNEELL